MAQDNSRSSRGRDDYDAYDADGARKRSSRPRRSADGSASHSRPDRARSSRSHANSAEGAQRKRRPRDAQHAEHRQRSREGAQRSSRPRSHEGEQRSRKRPAGQSRRQQDAVRASSKLVAPNKPLSTSSKKSHHASVQDYSRGSGAASKYRARQSSGGGRGKKIAIIVVIVLVIALLSCGIAAGLWYNRVASNLKGDADITATEVPPADEPYYVLLLGGDSRTDSKNDNHSDSIMLVRVDEQKKDVRVVSVPRDTRAYFEGQGYYKINTGIMFGGYDEIVNKLNEMMGIKINYYAFVYFDGFENIVDKLGGVTVEVPEGTYYAGVTVPAGDAVEINGKEALTLARCRHGNPPDQGAYAAGDYQRTLNQRNLVKAIAKKVLQQNVTEIPGLVEELSACVETNMPLDRLVGLATNLKGMDVDSIQTATVPTGTATINGAAFVVVFEDVFQIFRQNFANGVDLYTGLAKFNPATNGYEVGDTYVDGPVYTYANYRDKYGEFEGELEPETEEDTSSAS